MEAAEQGGKAAQEGEANKNKGTGHNPEECPVCMTVFDDAVQRPRTLPCGHTVCTLCVNQLKQQGHVACPECRASHAVPEEGQFPVCYIAEAFIKRRKIDGEAAAEASPSPSAGTWKGAAAAAGQKEADGISGKMRTFLQEQEAPVVAAITACQEVQAQLDQYQTSLRGWDEHHQQLEDRLQDLLDQSRSAREQVGQEESRAAAKKEEAREGERQLHAALEALRNPTTDKEAGVAVAEVFRCTGEAEQLLKKYRESFPDANTATTVRKVTEASYAVLEAFQAAPDLEAHPEPEADCTLLMPRLTIEHLRSRPRPLRRLLEAGRVFGVNEVNGQRRRGRISLEAGRVYLHSLKEGPLPPVAALLNVGEGPFSFLRVVFLDLSWPGSAPRRVHIRLSNNTPRGRLTMLLCTGQRGLSYAGTCLYKVGDKGCPGECVFGGDVKSEDGIYVDSLESRLHHGNYRESGKAGAVCAGSRGFPARSGAGAQFAIITKDNHYSYDGVFGEVVQGLDAVVAAAQHTPITEVTVSNCGVVF